MNFDNHHPTQYSIDILDLPIFDEKDDVMEPESQFCTLPNEINLEVIHGQESDNPPPAFNQVEDEIDIQHITSEAPQQDNPLLNVHDEIYLAPTTTSMKKLFNSKPKTKQAKSKRPKKTC